MTAHLTWQCLILSALVVSASVTLMSSTRPRAMSLQGTPELLSESRLPAPAAVMLRVAMSEPAVVF